MMISRSLIIIKKTIIFIWHLNFLNKIKIRKWLISDSISHMIFNIVLFSTVLLVLGTFNLPSSWCPTWKRQWAAQWRETPFSFVSWCSVCSCSWAFCHLKISIRSFFVCVCVCVNSARTRKNFSSKFSLLFLSLFLFP